jgi:hypothetical protein
MGHRWRIEKRLPGKRRPVPQKGNVDDYGHGATLISGGNDDFVDPAWRDLVPHKSPLESLGNVVKRTIGMHAAVEKAAISPYPEFAGRATRDGVYLIM